MRNTTKRFMIIFIVFSLLFFIGVTFFVFDDGITKDNVISGNDVVSNNQVSVGVTILERNETDR